MSKNPNVIDVYFGHPDDRPAQNNAQRLLEAAAGGPKGNETARATRKRGAARVAMAGLALTGLGVQTAINSAPEREVYAATQVPLTKAENVAGKAMDKVLFPSPLGKKDAYDKYDMKGKGNYKVYTIEQGDTEWNIASRTGLDPKHIDTLEHELIDPQLPMGMDAGSLDPGTTIRLPLDSAIGQAPEK